MYPDLLRRRGEQPAGATSFIGGLVQLQGPSFLVRSADPPHKLAISSQLGLRPEGQPDAEPRRITLYSSDFGMLAFKVRQGRQAGAGRGNRQAVDGNCAVRMLGGGCYGGVARCLPCWLAAGQPACLPACEGCMAGMHG